MKHASEYRAYAEECRTLAKRMESEHQQPLFDVARTWDKLAAASADLVRPHGELVQDRPPEAARRSPYDPHGASEGVRPLR
jgi:hypothetical protein